MQAWIRGPHLSTKRISQYTWCRKSKESLRWRGTFGSDPRYVRETVRTWYHGSSVWWKKWRNPNHVWRDIWQGSNFRSMPYESELIRVTGTFIFRQCSRNIIFVQDINYDWGLVNINLITRAPQFPPKRQHPNKRKYSIFIYKIEWNFSYCVYKFRVNMTKVT